MSDAMWPGRRRRETRKIQVGRACRSLVAAWLLALGSGCRGGPAEAPAPPEPAYTAEEATVFNDFFRPELFGLEATDTPPESDRLLPDRVARADVIVAARIVTVTREPDGLGATYSVVAQPVSAPLLGEPNGSRLVLTVRAKSPAYAWIETNRDACVGIRALIFARRYEDGLHFHASVDSVPVRDAVIRARIEASGRR